MTQQIQQTIEIPDELTGLRLDQTVAKLCPDYSRSLLKTWILSGEILLDGQTARPKDKVTSNQLITINATMQPNQSWEPQAISLDIIFEDEHLLIINKPAGLVVHPGAGNKDGTLLNAILYHAPHLAEITRGGIVHRIDKDTTGLLMIAKTLKAHTSLVEQLQNKTACREYLTLVQGTMISGATINKPIARHHKNRTHMAVSLGGKPAITHYRIEKKFKQHTLLRVNLATGRTHQIRVHMTSIGHPIIGDKVYGGRLKLPGKASQEATEALKSFPRQALHAIKLGLIHPETGETMQWEAPLPRDMQTLLSMLE